MAARARHSDDDGVASHASIGSRTRRGNATRPVTIEELLEHHVCRADPGASWLLDLEAPVDEDVTNVSPPITDGGQVLLAGRAEPRRDELLSRIQFFSFDRGDGTGHPVAQGPGLELQDPALVQLADGLVLSGVRTHVDERSGELEWETEIYAGASIETLEPLLRGPPGMKDIRFAQMDDRIAVFTRPQGRKGGRGKIGCLVVDHLDELTAEAIASAPLIEGLIADERGEWGGVNEAHYLGNGIFGLLYHVAHFPNPADPVEKRYYAAACLFDIRSGEVWDEQIIACRSCFPAAETKRPGLERVVFPGGLDFGDPRGLVLYAGLSDSHAGAMIVQNRFLAVALEQFIATLPLSDGEVAHLAWLDGLGLDEIASRLDREPAAVAEAARRNKRRLQEWLES